MAVFCLKSPCVGIHAPVGMIAKYLPKWKIPGQKRVDQIRPVEPSFRESERKRYMEAENGIPAKKAESRLVTHGFQHRTFNPSKC